MKIGYIRISTNNSKQNFDMQEDALINSGVDERNIFKDTASGAKSKRKGLEEALKYLKRR